ncbi:winged helix-turn-helix domain-containing protein [Halobacterium jilantaiense]|uniref:Helix-turn-helix domain-containing protein n=1 Tax=Halobacterium jilantaiense TaxID=355548 RepID=A0A1I0QRI5_9EURY|nr:helix-turn-helix domain-containing protein [Halobacterium jilantaiense]SEW29797.1 Helix-turn-helix domain-containing protein [Halobacterium jilantaiense]
MSQSQMARATRQDDAEETVTTTESVQGVLDALDDEECRAILEATKQESLTAAEISEECDLPSSTAYRKIDLLDDADLLTEELRIRRSGKHVSEYACAIDDVTLSVGDSGVELSVSHTEPAVTDLANPFAD